MDTSSISVKAAPVTELPTQYQRFIHRGHYARLLDDGARETWAQSVARYCAFITERYTPAQMTTLAPLLDDAHQAILRCEVMPSMRALMSAGAAARRNNVAMYNCAYTPIDSLTRFGEVMRILMNGAGVGFSCEQHIVDRLPPVAPPDFEPEVCAPSGCDQRAVQEMANNSAPARPPLCHTVADSQEGWVAAFDYLLQMRWLHGRRVEFDYSKVRPAGARLRTFGGRASGPEPLRRLFEYVDALLLAASGRQLRPYEVHHIVCHTADVVVSGGVRRSALISLSSLTDNTMRDIKTPYNDITEMPNPDYDAEDPESAPHTYKLTQVWPFTAAPWLALSNNSAVYNGRPADKSVFDEEWRALVASHAGERGIFNRDGALTHCATLSEPRLFPVPSEVGTNPCCEVLLRPQQFCNLTEAVIRADDTIESVTYKVMHAVLLGTLQAGYTHFPGLSDEWRRNCEAEALLGVSLTGICDNRFFSTPSPALEAALRQIRDKARALNKTLAALLGIKASAAITCVKPSGTVSQLADCASGIHPRWSHRYERSVRVSKRDPMYEFMRRAGVKCEDEQLHPDTTAVLYFPVEAPATARLRDHMSALHQLELWLCYQRNWCEHKPSCTIYVRPAEWQTVADWVWRHFEHVSGLSFLPYDNGIYPQAPYREVTDLAEFERLQAAMPKLDWAQLAQIERAQQHHYTPGGRVWACSGDSCEIVVVQ